MSKENYLYKGNVQIYLQGENALLPVASRNRGDQVAYFIGSKKSKLLIRDFRRAPIHAAHHASAGLDGSEFADAFNQPAYAEVSVSERGNEPEKIEINLRPTNEIYVMNADGTNPINLTNHPAGGGNTVWSPYSTKIAFVSGRDGNSEIYVINTDGSNLLRLTENVASDYSPAWSP